MCIKQCLAGVHFNLEAVLQNGVSFLPRRKHRATALGKPTSTEIKYAGKRLCPILLRSMNQKNSPANKLGWFGSSLASEIYDTSNVRLTSVLKILKHSQSQKFLPPPQNHTKRTKLVFPMTGTCLGTHSFWSRWQETHYNVLVREWWLIIPQAKTLILSFASQQLALAMRYLLYRALSWFSMHWEGSGWWKHNFLLSTNSLDIFHSLQVL